MRDALRTHAGDATTLAAVSTLPAGSGLSQTPGFNGKTMVTIGYAQAQALGFLPATALTNSQSGTVYDGWIGMGSGFSSNQYLAAALHEIADALGRVNGQEMDFYRYRAAGQQIFVAPQAASWSSSPAPNSYFSINGGITNLAGFGTTSDPAGFQNATSTTTNDPFDESVGTASGLTSLDATIMEVMGLHLSSAGSFQVDPTPASTATTTGIPMNGRVSGYINATGNSHWDRVTMATGHHYVLRADGVTSLGYGLDDPVIALINTAGTATILQDDNTGPGLSSEIDVNITSAGGTYFLAVGASSANVNEPYQVGSYTASVEESTFLRSNFFGSAVSDIMLQNGSTVVDWLMGGSGTVLDSHVVSSNAGGYTVRA